MELGRNKSGAIIDTIESEIDDYLDEIKADILQDINNAFGSIESADYSQEPEEALDEMIDYVKELHENIKQIVTDGIK